MVMGHKIEEKEKEKLSRTDLSSAPGNDQAVDKQEDVMAMRYLPGSGPSDLPTAR